MNVSGSLAPIDALAAHFRSSGSIEKHTLIGVPSFLQGDFDEKLNPQTAETRVSFTTKEVETLIESIGKEEFERWCLLDVTAFTFVTKVLLRAAPCLAQYQGLFRLIEALETLNNQNNEFAMPKEQLVDYKDIIGESLAVDLLTYFIKEEESEFSRRWVGLLLTKLLEDSEINRQRVWKMPDKTFKDIGGIITSGADRMLKIVAGKIIWQMMQYFGDKKEIRERLSTFCQSGYTGNFVKDFPLQNGSRWENGFATFITDMEEDRYGLGTGPPTGYNGYQVKLGSNNRINSELGAISISIAEIFSIYIPPNRDHSPDWVDFKIVNISRVEFTTQGVTDDAMKDLTYFKLHLRDYEGDGYLYLLSMRPSSDSNNVMILCDKTDAGDFAEDVERYRDEVLKRRSNNLSTSSAPVKDIQANPARHQSQKEKLNELERHRDDILKVLDSPTKSNINSTTTTDLSSSGVLGSRVDGKKMLEEPRKERVAGLDLVEVEHEINGPGSENFGRDSALFSIFPRQLISVSSAAAGGPVQGLFEVPDISLEKVEETPDPSLSTLHFTKNLLDKTSKTVLQSSPGHLRSSIRVQQTAKKLNVPIDSDSELSDLTSVPDGVELGLLFRDGKWTSEKSAESRVVSQNKPKAVAASLVFPGRPGSGDVEQRYKLEKKPEPPVFATAVEPLVIPARLAKSSLFREITIMKDHPEFKGTSKQLQPKIADAFGAPAALHKSPGVMNPAGATEEPRRKPGPAIRSPLNGVSITGRPTQSKANLRGNNQPTVPSTRPPDAPAKKAVVGSRDKAENKSTPAGPGKPATQANERHTGSEDTPTKKPRPAVRTMAGLLDDVLTPPSTYEARQMTQHKGKLKERLIGKSRESEKRTNNAQTAKTRPNPASRSYKTAGPEKPLLVSPEDTSIWDLPESEHSGKVKKIPPKRKGKAEPKKQSPFSKERQPPKKRAYGKKPVEEDLLHASAPIPKPKQKVPPKSVAAKRGAVRDNNGGKSPAWRSKPKAVRKLAPASVPAKIVTVQESDEEMNTAEEYKPPIFNPSRDLKPKPKPKPNSKFALGSVPTRRVMAGDSEYVVINSGEEQILPTRSPKPSFLQRVSAPAKRLAAQNTVGGKNQSVLLIKGRKLEQEKAARTKATPGSSRTVVKKAQEASKKHQKFDIFQETVESDADSSWRPKTRLQVKMELAAKSTSQKKVTEVGNKNSRGKEFRETESSEESQSEYKDVSSPAVRPRKALGATGIPGWLSTGVNGPGTVRRSLSLSSETNVKTPKKRYEQAIEPKRVEALVGEKLHLLERLVPGMPSQPSTTTRDKRAELGGVTSNHISSEYWDVILTPSDHSSSESDLEPMDINDSITLAEVPGNYNGIDRPAMGQSKARNQLSSDTEIPENPAIRDQDIDEPVKEHRRRNVSSDGELTENVVMDLGASSLALTEFSSNSSSSRASSSEKENSKLLSPVTPRRLDKILETPFANPTSLVDDHLARKVQIISWNSEGPKNQGRTPVVDQGPVHLDTPLIQEGSTNGRVPPKFGRAPSLYVLASEDEDRIVRRKKSMGSYIARLTRRSTGTIIDSNGSPSLATGRGHTNPMEPLQSDDDQEKGEEGQVDSVIADIVDSVVRPTQESYTESGQDNEWHPASIERLGEARRTNRVDSRDASTSLEVGVISDDEDQAPSIIGSTEGVEVFAEDEGPVAARVEPPQVHCKNQVSHKISIIEILESDVEKTGEVAQAKPFTTKHRKYGGISFRSKTVTEKADNTIKHPPPTPKKRLYASNKRPIAVPGRLPVLQPSLPAAREIPATDGAPTGNGHPQTGFLNWLQEAGFKKANSGNHGHNCRNSLQGPGGKLKSVDPDQTLVNEGDFGGAESDWNFFGDSEGEPERGQRLRRDLCGGDSDDSSDPSTNNNEDSGSDGEVYEGEALSEAEGDPQLAWRQSLPDYHRETLAVLDQISQGLLRYLMSGEELAMEVIKDFEKQGNEIVRQLGESHKKEYGSFLIKANIGKEEVQKKHAIIMKAVEHDMAELQRQQLTLADLRTNINDDYSALDDTISRIMARLEDELEGGV